MVGDGDTRRWSLGSYVDSGRWAYGASEEPTLYGPCGPAIQAYSPSKAELPTLWQNKEALISFVLS
jgi:hypothetical protein